MPASCWREPGRRAHDRGDRRAAASLLERSAGLLPEPDPRHVLTLLDLGRGLTDTADDLQGAERRSSGPQAEADLLERDDLRIKAQLELSFVRLLTDATLHDGRARNACPRRDRGARAAPGRRRSRARVVRASRWRSWSQARWDRMLEPLDRSIEHARRAGNRSMELEALTFLLAALLFGSTPVNGGSRTRARDPRERSRQPRPTGLGPADRGIAGCTRGPVRRGQRAAGASARDLQ